MGRMENKMETTMVYIGVILGLYWDYIANIMVPVIIHVSKQRSAFLAPKQ